jgi:predicted cupin superfamily sugar epimerase
VLTTPQGERPLATCVSFLLTPGDVSRWHRVRSQELWLWQGGGRLELSTGGADAAPCEPETHTLGMGGQFLVPANVWQTARPVDQAVLVACIVSPGFDFADFELLPE